MKKQKRNSLQRALDHILLFSSQRPFVFSVLAPTILLAVFMLLTLAPLLPALARSILVSSVVGFLFLGILIIGPLFVRSWFRTFGVKISFLEGYYALLSSLAGRK